MTKKGDRDPLDTHAEEAATAEEAQAQRFRNEQEVGDLRHLMSSMQGRRFMWRLLDKAGVFRTSFSTNGLEMAFNEGNRNHGIELMLKLNEHCPRDYQLMVKEAKNDRSKRTA